jgi:hypothetical protein
MTHEFHEMLEMAVTGRLERTTMATKVYSGNRTKEGHPIVMTDSPSGWVQLEPEPSQAIRNHSPDGFNFGFGGSGPSQLALAILLDFTGDAVIAEKYYRKFLWAYVATWGDKWQITGEEIKAWLIEERLK